MHKEEAKIEMMNIQKSSTASSNLNESANDLIILNQNFTSRNNSRNLDRIDIEATVQTAKHNSDRNRRNENIPNRNPRQHQRKPANTFETVDVRQNVPPNRHNIQDLKMKFPKSYPKQPSLRIINHPKTETSPKRILESFNLEQLLLPIKYQF